MDMKHGQQKRDKLRAERARGKGLCKPRPTLPSECSPCPWRSCPLGWCRDEAHRGKNACRAPRREAACDLDENRWESHKAVAEGQLGMDLGDIG